MNDNIIYLKLLINIQINKKLIKTMTRTAGNYAVLKITETYHFAQYSDRYQICSFYSR